MAELTFPDQRVARVQNVVNGGLKNYMIDMCEPHNENVSGSIQLGPNLWIGSNSLTIVGKVLQSSDRKAVGQTIKLELNQSNFYRAKVGRTNINPTDLMVSHVDDFELCLCINLANTTDFGDLIQSYSTFTSQLSYYLRSAKVHVILLNDTKVTYSQDLLVNCLSGLNTFSNNVSFQLSSVYKAIDEHVKWTPNSKRLIVVTSPRIFIDAASSKPEIPTIIVSNCYDGVALDNNCAYHIFTDYYETYKAVCKAIAFYTPYFVNVSANGCQKLIDNHIVFSAMRNVNDKYNCVFSEDFVAAKALCEQAGQVYTNKAFREVVSELVTVKPDEDVILFRDNSLWQAKAQDLFLFKASRYSLKPMPMARVFIQGTTWNQKVQGLLVEK